MFNNFSKEFLFVKFPIIFPILYFFVLFYFPNFETLLIFTTILILAEPHFGATWPFFLNKTNHNFINENKINLIYAPIAIVLFSIIGFFLIKKIFLLIFFLFNVFHVTRQSFGITKLYSKSSKENSYNEYLIYGFNALFFLIAYLRFFLGYDIQNLLFLNLIVLSLILLTMLFYFFHFGFTSNIFTSFTGVIIFYPACFVENPVHVILMGVTMHFSQYLFLTHKVVKKRLDNLDEFSTKKICTKFLIPILIYGIVMAILSLTNESKNISIQNLIIIPIIGQMLHFYLDSQLWKFSIKHNRDNVLKHIMN